MGDAVTEWISRGGQAFQLIEPVDGFHPSQWAQPLITEFFWRYLQNNFPQAMPPSTRTTRRLPTSLATRAATRRGEKREAGQGRETARRPPRSPIILSST